MKRLSIRSAGSSSPGDNAATRRCHWRFLGWAGLLGALVLIAGYFLFRGTAEDGNAQDLQSKGTVVPTFVGWEKPRPPDLAIVISGQTHGYLQPCGCSYPQKGGLARRNNFIQTLKDKGWPVAALDLGDVAQASGPQQRLKYETSMKALKVMGYQAVGIGKNEFLMPLTQALASYSINDPLPRPVVANLANTSKNELFHALNVRKGEIFKAGDVRVGVVGAVDDEIAKIVAASLPPNEKNVVFLDRDKSLATALNIVAENKVDLGVLLYQGHEKQAMKCAESLHQEHLRNAAVAPVHIMLCLTEDEEPPGIPQKAAGAPGTAIITIGHKGRYVGVVGVWKSVKGVDLKYQLVAMGPEFETKPGKEAANPVMDLMEKYAAKVRDDNYLARYPRGNHAVQVNFKDARYVGSERCGDCHDHAYKVWEKSEHSHAFQTLVDAKNPRLRQFDGECVACHTVGFNYRTGFFDPPLGSTPKEIDKHNKRLLNVGCESCHGPGSEHANDPNNKALYSFINPYRPTPRELEPATPADDRAQAIKQRMLRMDIRLCQQCHDPENDVNWGNVSFEKKWGLIAHPTPGKGAGKAKGQ